MGAFGRTAAEYGALSRPTQRRHTPQPRMTRVLFCRAWLRRTRRGGGGSDAGGSADWVTDVIRAFLLSPSKGGNCSDRACWHIRRSTPRVLTTSGWTGPDQAGPGHDRVDRLPGHRGPDQSGCGGLRDPGGPHASPGTLRRRTHEGPQRGAHQTSGQDLGIPYAISFRSRNPPVSDTKPR
jgi:hypothetical protein